MNKVITINLNGNAYQLDEAGYDALYRYLKNAGNQLKENPDQAEIIADLEQAIAEKCAAYLRANKTVVSENEVAQILKDMGPVDTGESNNTTPDNDATDSESINTSDNS